MQLNKRSSDLGLRLFLGYILGWETSQCAPTLLSLLSVARVTPFPEKSQGVRHHSCSQRSTTCLRPALSRDQTVMSGLHPASHACQRELLVLHRTWRSHSNTTDVRRQLEPPHSLPRLLGYPRIYSDHIHWGRHGKNPPLLHSHS